MADDAFALSPISARAALPSEEDYAAIAEAFMETSRGRWFLNEYAKRNRNADTRMVLDAVARIEQGLAAQKEESLQKEANLHREENLHRETLEAHQQQAAEAVAAATAARGNLNDALAAMRGAVEAAQQSAAEALDNLALESLDLSAFRLGHAQCRHALLLVRSDPHMGPGVEAGKAVRRGVARLKLSC